MPRAQCRREHRHHHDRPSVRPRLGVCFIACRWSPALICIGARLSVYVRWRRKRARSGGPVSFPFLVFLHSFSPRVTERGPVAVIAAARMERIRPASRTTWTQVCGAPDSTSPAQLDTREEIQNKRVRSAEPRMPLIYYRWRCADSCACMQPPEGK